MIGLQLSTSPTCLCCCACRSHLYPTYTAPTAIWASRHYCWALHRWGAGGGRKTQAGHSNQQDCMIERVSGLDCGRRRTSGMARWELVVQPRPAPAPPGSQHHGTA